MGNKMLVVDPRKCNGCGRCEAACASKMLIRDQLNGINYRSKEVNISFEEYKAVALNRSRIKVIRDEKNNVFIPLSCLQCADPACANACVNKAIKQNALTGAYEIDRDACIGCKVCVVACPFGAINFDKISREILKCDFCGGYPQCATFCPTGAIEFKEEINTSLDKKKKTAKKFYKHIGNDQVKEA